MKFSSKKMFALASLFSITTSFGSIAIFQQEGHTGVTRSLFTGLKKLDIPFESNTCSPQSDVAIVLAGYPYVQHAIELKRAGRIQKLLVGPNVVTRANERGGICGSAEVDACLVPSEWVKIAYEKQLPNLRGRIHIWKAGIHSMFLSPSLKKKSKVIIYWKTEPESFVQEIEHMLKKFSFETVRLKYGKYNSTQYHAHLSEAVVAIFISRSESQGLALAEAWGMDVPTFVWNPEQLYAHGWHYIPVSAAPYLTPATGCFWKTTKELEQLMNQFVQGHLSFSPHNWMLEHGTDEISARQLLEIIDSIE